jgi:uncharacterized protein (DUF305 family)
MKVILLFIFLIIFYLTNIPKTVEKFEEKNICRGKLTDREYLEHMIPHHQVAVDISIMLQKITKSPYMQNILRSIIWAQNYEIQEMKFMLKSLPQKVSSDDKMNTNYIPVDIDYQKPNIVSISKEYCDPNFFNPEKHMKHMKHMKLNNTMYIKHMIPHHQVAIDMSKVLIKNTKNDFMLAFAYKIIRAQKLEIYLLDQILKNKHFYYKSTLIN